MDLRNLLLHLRDNPSDRAVALDTGINRRTVQRYRRWATDHHLLTDPLPSLHELQSRRLSSLPTSTPPQNVSSVEPFRELVLTLRGQGTEVAAICQRLKERGFQGHYSSVYRFIRSLEPGTPDAVVRVEREPGEEAQVDFGDAGLLLDPSTGTPRKAYAFVMLLAWSRHMFVAFVFDQSVASWIDLHRRAFAFFGGVPQRVVLDNLKAGITKASWDDPQVHYTYRECAAHYGFRIAPCRPATPQHKGKVEQGGVHYVKRNFLGGRAPSSLDEANAAVLEWCGTTAGLRVHGTTRQVPLVRFHETEQAQLKPLPVSSYNLGIWKQVKLHRDCYVVFDSAYYSAPFRLVGQQLLVRGGSSSVQLYTSDYQLVATHTRAQHKGQRLTQLDHLPSDKLPGLLRSREGCLVEAERVGAATRQVVQTLLDDEVVDRLYSAGRVLRLAKRFTDARLEAACTRGLAFGDTSYRTLERMLLLQLEQQSSAELSPPVGAQQFVRSAEELVGQLTGGVQWT